MTTSFKRLNVDDYNLTQIQNNIEEFSRPITNSEVIDGVLLEDISLVSASTTSVPHKLGRNIQGWIVVRNDTNCAVWETTASTDNEFIALNTSADTTVSLWVF